MSIYPLFEFPWEGRTLVEEAPEPPRVILKQNMLKTIKFICVSIFNLAGGGRGGGGKFDFADILGSL